MCGTVASIFRQDSIEKSELKAGLQARNTLLRVQQDMMPRSSVYISSGKRSIIIHFRRACTLATSQPIVCTADR